ALVGQFFDEGVGLAKTFGTLHGSRQAVRLAVAAEVGQARGVRQSAAGRFVPELLLLRSAEGAGVRSQVYGIDLGQRYLGVFIFCWRGSGSGAASGGGGSGAEFGAGRGCQVREFVFLLAPHAHAAAFDVLVARLVGERQSAPDAEPLM